MGTSKPPEQPGSQPRPSLLDRRNFKNRQSASLQGLGPRGPRGLGYALAAARLIDEDEEPTPYLAKLLGELVDLLGTDPTLPRPNAIHALRPLALEIHVRNAIEIFQRRYHLCPTGRFDRPTLMEMARKEIVDEPRFIKKPPPIPLPPSAPMHSGGGKPLNAPASAPPSSLSAPGANGARPPAGRAKRGLS